MKAEEFLNNWLNKKYAGAKELEPWTGEEIVSLLKDFQKEIWIKAQEFIVETEENDEFLPVEILEAEDLREILDIRS